MITDFCISTFKRIFGVDIAMLFIGLMLVLVAAIVIPNFSKIASVFGYDTRAVLKEKLDVSKQNTQIAVEANIESTKTVKVLEKTIVNTEEVIVAKFEEDKKAVTINNTIKEKKDKKIKVIMDNPTTPEAQALEISTIQIVSLWDSYCGFNNDSSCPSPTATPANG